MSEYTKNKAIRILQQLSQGTLLKNACDDSEVNLKYQAAKNLILRFNRSNDYITTYQAIAECMRKGLIQ